MKLNDCIINDQDVCPYELVDGMTCHKCKIPDACSHGGMERYDVSAPMPPITKLSIETFLEGKDDNFNGMTINHKKHTINAVWLVCKKRFKIGN